MGRRRFVRPLFRNVQQSGQSLRQAAIVNAVYKEFGSPTEFARQFVSNSSFVSPNKRLTCP